VPGFLLIQKLEPPMAKSTLPRNLTRRAFQLLVLCEQEPDGFVPLVRSDEYLLASLGGRGLVERCGILGLL